MTLRNTRKQLLQFEKKQKPAEVETLDVSANELTDVLGLEPFGRLHSLDLSQNKLDGQFGALSGNITKLNVSNNGFETLQGLDHLQFLTEIDISRNQLTTLSGLSHNIQLKVLRASTNKLQSTSGIEHLKLLETIDLRKNHIESLDGLHELHHLDKVKTIQLKGNGVCKLPSFRLTLSQIAPSLVSVDGDKIAKSSRGYKARHPSQHSKASKTHISNMSDLTASSTAIETTTSHRDHSSEGELQAGSSDNQTRGNKYVTASWATAEREEIASEQARRATHSSHANVPSRYLTTAREGVESLIKTVEELAPQFDQRHDQDELAHEREEVYHRLAALGGEASPGGWGSEDADVHMARSSPQPPSQLLQVNEDLREQCKQYEQKCAQLQNDNDVLFKELVATESRLLEAEKQSSQVHGDGSISSPHRQARLEKENAEMRHKLNASIAEMERIKHEGQNRKAELQREVKAMENTINKSSRSRKEMEKQMEALEKRAERAEMKLLSFSQVSGGHNASTLELKLEAAQKENRRLAKELSVVEERLSESVVGWDLAKTDCEVMAVELESYKQMEREIGQTSEDRKRSAEKLAWVEKSLRLLSEGVLSPRKHRPPSPLGEKHERIQSRFEAVRAKIASIDREKDELRSEVASLKSEAAALAGERDAQAERIRSLEEAYQRVVGDNVSLEGEVIMHQDLESRLATLSVENPLQLENDRLKETLQMSVEESTMLSKQVGDLQQEVYRLESEKEGVEKLVSEAIDSMQIKDDVSMLTEDNEKLRRMLSALETEMKEKRDSVIENLRNEVKSSERSANLLEKELSGARSAIESLQKSSSEKEHTLRNEIDTLSLTVEELRKKQKADRDIMLGDMKEMEAKLKYEHEKELREARMGIAKARGSNDDLEREIDMLKAEHSRQQSQDRTELERLRRELDLLQKRKADVEEEMEKRISKLSADKDWTEGELARTNEYVREVSENLNRARDQLDESKAEVNRQKQSHQRAMQECELKIDELETEVSALKIELKSGDEEKEGLVTTSKETKAVLQSAIDTLNEELDVANAERRKIMELTQEKEVGMEQKIAELKEDVSALNLEREEEKAVHDDIVEKLHHELEDLKVELGSQEKHIEGLQSAKHSLETEVNQERQRFAAQLAELENALSDAVHGNQGLASKSKRETESLSERLRSLADELNETKKYNDKLQQEVEDLTHRLRQEAGEREYQQTLLTKELEEEKFEREKMEREASSLRTRLGELVEEMDVERVKYFTAIEKDNVEVQSSQRSVTLLRDELELLRSEKRSASERHISEKEMLQGVISKLEGQINASRHAREELNDNMDSLRAKLQSTEAKLESTTSELEISHQRVRTLELTKDSSNHQREEVVAQNAELRKEVEEARSLLEGMRTGKEDVMDRDAMLSDLLSAKLKSVEESRHEVWAEKQAQYEVMTKEISRLEKDLADARERLSAAMSSADVEKVELRREIHSLELESQGQSLNSQKFRSKLLEVAFTLKMLKREKESIASQFSKEKESVMKNIHEAEWKLTQVMDQRKKSWMKLRERIYSPMHR